jgi:NADPH:quinone reductase-like Zn-dependent oxidoreductase
MRAFTLDSFDTPPRLRDDIPAPSPEPNEVLVSVYGSSVNGADVPIAAGMLKDMVEYEFPVTLGRDFAGVVEQVGSAISRYRAGDEVYGFVPHADPTVHKGSWADQVAVREDATARKPGSVDFETAGAAPLAGISALAALEALELSEGAAVLVIGAAGGVGSFFVQLAAAAGANVITRGFPKTMSTCAGWAPPRSSNAARMWPRRSASSTRTASTRFSTWSRLRPTTLCSSGEDGLPQRSAPPEKGPAVAI